MLTSSAWTVAVTLDVSPGLAALERRRRRGTRAGGVARMAKTAGKASSGLSSHIPGMAEAMESVSDKLKAAGEGGIFKRHSGAADVIVVSYRGAGEERWGSLRSYLRRRRAVAASRRVSS